MPSREDEAGRKPTRRPPSLPEGPYRPTWESLSGYTVPDWYLDGKFGIFIHWGVYSVPAFGNEWYPRNMYRQGTKEYDHHIATYGPQSRFGYLDFIEEFTAERFDADAMADLFVRSGARFVVPVAEHHDGFAMYDCSLSEWNAVKMGPKRDVVGLIAAAVRKRGLTFGLSSHRAEHWWFMNGGMEFESDVQDPRYADFYGPAAPEGTQPDAEYLDDWLARTCELVDKYQPQLIWFDWWIEQPAFAPYLQRFAAYYYNRADEWSRLRGGWAKSGPAINYKHGAFPPEAAVFDVERGQLTDIRPLFWQTDTAVAKASWGYVEGQEYKTPGAIVGDLVDIVSKNGALLLNIGPRPDGTIPDEEVAILESIGDWLRVNGEAIYGTRPWKVFGEGPTEIVGGSFSDTKRQTFTSRDVRFTTKGDTLYAIALGLPDGDLTIQSLGTNLKLLTRPIVGVSLLGSDERLEWERTGTGLRVALPAKLPCEHAVALRVEVG